MLFGRRELNSAAGRENFKISQRRERRNVSVTRTYQSLTRKDIRRLSIFESEMLRIFGYEKDSSKLLM
jgi:hypothetical protein